MTFTFDGIIEFLRVAPGILLFPFGFYFGYKKIGYRIGFQLTVSLSPVRGKHIGSIIFQNFRDRPLLITEIFGIQGNVKFEIEKPDAPLLLKSLETIVVNPAHYTKYVCKGELFEIDVSAIRKLRIFVVTPEKTVECTHIYKPTKEIETYSNRFDGAHKIFRAFNDVVYGDDSAFAIVYTSEKKNKTLIVSKNGFIYDSDCLGCNSIPKGNLTPDGITAYIKMKTGMDVHAFELRHD